MFYNIALSEAEAISYIHAYKTVMVVITMALPLAALPQAAVAMINSEDRACALNFYFSVTCCHYSGPKFIHCA